jgi:hypothetical protein
MQFASGGLGSVALATILQDPGASNDEALSPIVTTLNSMDIRDQLMVETLRIDDTLGQPVTASFVLKNSLVEIGDVVQIRYFSQVIFAGFIDRIQRTSPDLDTVFYDCQCLDWSRILLRRKIRRNFTNATVQSIVESILDIELFGEGLTMGTIDARAILPLVETKNAKVFDVLRSVAAAAGQSFYVDYDQTIQMRSTTVPQAPLLVNEANTLLDQSRLTKDTDVYRNRQTVVVTGTPPNASTDAQTVTSQRENVSEITVRATIEGGTGIYEEFEEVTHPTSNDPVQLALLGISYASLRLATSSVTRLTLTCRMQGYGFRAGQVASVNLPAFGVIGEYVIQKVSLTEMGGTRLSHVLELTNSSLQQRAYETWLKIVSSGAVIVQGPGFIATHLSSFGTSGTTTWTVPAGVTVVEFTTYGTGGGGGGGHYGWTQNYGTCYNNANQVGGHGGPGGKAVAVFGVEEGQVYDLAIGAGGVAGVSGAGNVFTWPPPGTNCTTPVTQTSGQEGGVTTVKLGALVVCQANSGGLGTYGYNGLNGVDGAVGGGVGDGVTPGAGALGGVRGAALVQPTAGGQGKIEVRW